MRAPALLLALGLLPATAAAKPPKLDTASLEAFARSLYGEHFDKMDMDAPLDTAALVMFVADEQGKPITVRGPADADAMKARFAAWKAGGWKMTTTFDALACEARADLGLCTAVVTQALTEGDEDQGELHVRATLVARPVDGRWAVVHLHESPAAAPPAP